MRPHFLFIIAVVLFLIPVVLIALDETTNPRTLNICLFGGLAAFAAAHWPWP